MCNCLWTFTNIQKSTEPSNRWDETNGCCYGNKVRCQAFLKSASGSTFPHKHSRPQPLCIQHIIPETDEEVWTAAVWRIINKNDVWDDHRTSEWRVLRRFASNGGKINESRVKITDSIKTGHRGRDVTQQFLKNCCEAQNLPPCL